MLLRDLHRKPLGERGRELARMPAAIESLETRPSAAIDRICTRFRPRSVLNQADDRGQLALHEQIDRGLHNAPR